MTQATRNGLGSSEAMPLAEHLVQNSQAAMMAAIEIYNKPMFP